MRMLPLLLSAGVCCAPVRFTFAEEPAPAAPFKSEIDALTAELGGSFGEIYTHRVDVLRRELHLDQARIEKLAGFTENLGKEVAEQWRAHDLPADVRLGASGQPISGTSVLPMPEMPEFTADAAWQKALATVLTPAELSTANTFAAERLRRRLRAGAQEMVLVLDEHIALSRTQRELLQPVAERLLKGNSLLTDDDVSDDHTPGGEITESVFLSAGAAATEEELRAILNETQIRHWRQCCLAAPPETEETEDDEADDGQVELNGAGEAPLPRLTEEAEGVLSEYFAQKAALVRSGFLSALQLRVEEMDRVCTLPEAARRRLLLAARGAAERSLAKWRGPYEMSTRERLRPSSHLPLPQRLAALDRQAAQEQAAAVRGPVIPGLDRGDPELLADGEAFWTEALQEVRAGLTPAQLAALKAENEERAVFRTRVLAESVVTDFDHQHLLTGEQFGKLTGLVITLVRNRGAEDPAKHQEVAASFLSSQCRFISIFGLPKKAVRETLSDAQWKEWKDSEAYSECAEVWPGLQQKHSHK